MRYGVLVLLFLVAIMEAIASKSDPSSAETEVKSDARDVPIDDDTIEEQISANMDLNRRKKPGNTPAKGPFNGGCYTDTTTKKILRNKEIGPLNPNSPDICKTICQLEDYKFAGIEAGTKCYCGNEVFLKNHPEVVQKRCSTPCPGNPGIFCGGKKKNTKGKRNGKLFMNLYDSSPCPSGWTYLNNGCYRFRPVKGKTIEKAYNACANKGGYLVEIDSQIEQDTLHQFTKDHGLHDWVWTGGLYKDGKWIWFHSGKNITYTAWASGQPTGEGKCLGAGNDDFLWVNIRCGNIYTRHEALCEYDLCPEGWTYFKTGCYRFLPEEGDAETIEEARQECENEKGFLVEINNQYEQDSLYVFSQNNNITDWSWLGGFYKNGKWIWSHSGRKITYTAWDIGQPTNEGTENCLVAWHNFLWTNIGCDHIYTGHKALCEYKDPCQEPFAVPGRCNGRFPKWSYNQNKGRCEKFIYGGCPPASSNRFDTLLECENTCEIPTDPCEKPFAVRGPCKGKYKRWSYNQIKGRCQKFIYGGCYGSRNRFKTIEDCENTCHAPAGETQESVLVIIENGQEVTQEISFNDDTGILTIDVPPHISAAQENFTQATTTFDIKTNVNVLKTNNSCVLSEIPDYINAAAMPEYFQQVKEGTVTWDNSNKAIVYDIKMVESVVSPEDRKEITPALDSLCNNEVIKKAENKPILEDQYKNLTNDGIIFLDDDSEKRTGCTIRRSCTSNGPRSCGNFGWYNPVLNRHITMHQVSANSVCVKCCQKTSPLCDCEKHWPEYCSCTKITNKEIVMDCMLGNNNGVGEYHVPIQDSDSNARAATTQLLTYNSKNDARSVKIHVPSHGDVAETTLLMHAHTSGYWHTGSLNNNMMVKVGSTCYVKTLPGNMFPVDIALGIKHINAGNFTLKPEYETNKYMAIRAENEPLTYDEWQNLNPEIREVCNHNETIKYEEIDVNATEFQSLKDGKVIDLKKDQETRACVFKTYGISNRNPRGCWRFSNPDAGIEISVHNQASETLEVKCCTHLVGPNCCIDSGYCYCNDITDWTTFQRCRTPIETEIGDGSSCQTDEYDRDTGDLVVTTESCNDSSRSIQSPLEEATTGLYESQDLQLIKKGNSCYVLPLGERDPTKIAQETAEIAKEINGEITPGMETVSTSIIVPNHGPIPVLPEHVDYCDGINITLAEEVQIEETQFQDLQDGKIITLPQSVNIIEEGKCVLETKCASNSGTSGFWWPISTEAISFLDHGLIATPTCLSCCIEGMDPEYCECNQIYNLETFQQCIPKQEMAMVITGAHGTTEYNLVNRFIRNQSSPGLQLDALPLGGNSDFPVKTSGSVGVWIENRLIVCQGTAGVDDGCYEMNFGNKTWTQGGDFEFLVDPLTWGGASAKYNSGPTGNEPGETWWIIGGDPKTTKTQVWNSVAGANPWAPPVLPLKINTPCCMTAVSDREVFVTAYPMDVPADSNLAWIFSRDYTENDGWKALPSLKEERFGAACGFIPNNGSGWVVVAGGYEKSSSEYLDLSKCLDPQSDGCAWESGPDLGGNFYGASIVRMSTDELVLFGDHTDILAIDSTFANWEVVGQISQPRYSAVVLAIN